MNGFQKQFLFPGRTIRYLSKAGNDANSGATGDAPVLTAAVAFALDSTGVNFNFGSNSVLLVGDGVYEGGLPGISSTLVADGKVVFNLANQDALLGTDNADYGTITGCTFLFINRLRGGLRAGGSSGRARSWFKCVLSFNTSSNDNIFFEQNFSNNIFNDCILYRARVSVSSAGTGEQVIRSYLFGCVMKGVQELRDSYTDPTTDVELANLGVIQNCNIQGRIRIAGDSYGYTDLATFKFNYNLQARADLVSVAPQFNNALRQDYTLRINSPHLGAGIGPSQLRYALSWYVASTCTPGQVCTPSNTWLVNSADGSIVNFLSLQGFSWSQQGSLYITENTNNVFTANYRTAPLQIASTAQIIKSIPVFTGLNFNTSYPASEGDLDSNQPDVQNNNVPVVASNLSGSTGRNPRRLSVAMRWSTRQAPQSNTPADWVTGGLFPAFQIDTDPTWNQSSSLGNADDGYDANPSNVQTVRALWVQFDYTARNNYYSK